MFLYFDLLPDELVVIIIYYLPIDEVRKNEYLKNKLVNKWLLLFTFAFPDIYLNLIESINYSHSDFDYSYIIYKQLEYSYSSVIQEVDEFNSDIIKQLEQLKSEEKTKDRLLYIYTENNVSYEFNLYQIVNHNLKYLLLNKEQKLKELYIKNFGIETRLFLYIFYDRSIIITQGLTKEIELTRKEALTLAVYIEYIRPLIADI